MSDAGSSAALENIWQPKGNPWIIAAAVSLAAFLLRVNPLLILLCGGLIGMLTRRVVESVGVTAALLVPTAFPFRTAFSAAAVAGTLVARPSLGRIALFFLKVGAVLYGGGYVLLAFLEQGLVQQHAWLTRQQLLDAVAALISVTISCSCVARSVSES